MSWSAECEVKPTESVENAISELTVHGQKIIECVEQFMEAKKIALQIVSSGAVGKGGYTIRLSGHANPKHEPTEGYANDFISVLVSHQENF